MTATEDTNAVPVAVDEEKTAPMRFPADAVPNPFEEFEEEEETNVLPAKPYGDFSDDEKTVVPTGD